MEVNEIRGKEEAKEGMRRRRGEERERAEYSEEEW